MPTFDSSTNQWVASDGRRFGNGVEANSYEQTVKARNDSIKQNGPSQWDLNQRILNENNAAREKALAETPDWQKKDLSEDNALPWQTYLPKEIEGLASGIQSRGQNPGLITNQLLQGVEGGHVKGPDALGGNSLMSSAIAKKYEGQLGEGIESLKNKTKADELKRGNEEMMRAADVFGRSQAIKMQNFREQYEYQAKRKAIYEQWKNAKSQAEASMWSSILGGVFTVGAALIPGAAPAVAAAGAANTIGNISNTA